MVANRRLQSAVMRAVSKLQQVVGCAVHMEEVRDVLLRAVPSTQRRAGQQRIEDYVQPMVVVFGVGPTIVQQLLRSVVYFVRYTAQLPTRSQQRVCQYGFRR